MTACRTCNEIAVIEAGDDPYAIARTATGYLQLERRQYHSGYCIFQAKTCVKELYELDHEELHHQIDEMVSLSEAIARAFHPVKMNYEALGNTPGGHLHWHLVPRRADDPHLTGPIWRDPEFMRLLATGGGAQRRGALTPAAPTQGRDRASTRNCRALVCLRTAQYWW